MFKRHALAAIATATLALTAPAIGHADDAALFAVYDQVNGFDIETATLGAVKGSSEEVRALAAMVLRDHSAVRQMTRDLAKRLDVAYAIDAASAGAADHEKAIGKLSALSGAEFDKAYLEHEIGFHRAAIDAVKTSLLPAIENAEFKGLVEAVLPGFEHHLAETLRVAGMPAAH
ncbi:MAG TPA: DUF4142 domain-containing protein [Kaistiaceae bacterium]|nr:DUF4142 domain-containing protein [Kaistiaceae bacterium]